MQLLSCEGSEQRRRQQYCDRFGQIRAIRAVNQGGGRTHIYTAQGGAKQIIIHYYRSEEGQRHRG
jgi:hypothetical protein